jgi:hypothetical protein
MSGPVEVTTAADNGAPAAEVEAGSILARVRARAEKQRQARHLDLAVGGAFGDLLVIRYRALEVDELERYSELVGSIGNVSLAIDLMVSTAQTVLWREDGEETDLGVGLDMALWQGVLGWDLPPGVETLAPRDVVVGLFGGEGFRLGRHVGELMEWATEEQVSPGESWAPTS